MSAHSMKYPNHSVATLKSGVSLFNTLQKKMRALGLIAGMLLVSNAQAVQEGYFDTAATCTSLTGWAWETTLPNTPVSVDLYDGTTFLMTVPANIFRQDVLTAGKGNGIHAFATQMPPALINGVSHSVNAKFAGTSTLLNNSPKTIGPCTPSTASLSATSLTFGNQAINTSSATQTIYITNTGSAVLSIGSDILAGNNGGQFFIAPTSTCITGTSIPANGTCRLDVQFKPLANLPLGVKTATVTFTDNATPSTQVVTLTGTTINPPNTTATLSASALNFTTAPLTSSAAQTLTLTNTGTLPLVIYDGAVTLTGANANQFALATGSTCIVAGSGVTLAAGASCTVNVQYVPTIAAVSGTSYPATVSVALNTAVTPMSVALTGQLTASTSNVTLSVASLTFGNQAMNTVSAVQTVTVTNKGTAALSISSAVFSGANPGQFAIDSTNTCSTGASIAAGGTCKLAVKFTPTPNQSAGVKTAYLTLTDNGTPTTQVVTVTGTTINAPNTTASLSASTLNFTTQPFTSSAAQTITVTNTGTLPLIIYNGVGIGAITLTGTNANQFTIASSSTCLTATGASLAAGASCTVNVQYTPTASAAVGTTYTANVSLALNTATTPMTVTLSGQLTTLPTTVSLSATSLTFAAQGMTTRSPVQTVTVTNTGTTALSINSTTLGNPNPGQFVIASTSTCIAGANIAAGATCKVDLQFTPGTNLLLGVKSSFLTLTDNANPTTQVVALSGTTVLAPNTTASLSATALTFATQPLTTSAIQTLTVSNTGTLPLVIYDGSITLTGANPSQFTIVATGSTCILAGSGVTLAAGANCTVKVQYTPLSTAVVGTTYTANVSLALNTAVTPMTVALTGNMTTLPTTATLSATSLTFGNQAYTTTSAAQTVTVTNTGTTALSITSAVLGGPNPGQFLIAATSTCNAGANIAAGATCKLDLQFKPGTNQPLGAKSATLTLTDNAAPTTQVINLTGATIFPPNTTASLSASTFSFTTLPLTSSAIQTLTVTNTGTLPLVIYNNAVTLTGTGANQFTLASGGTCIPAGLGGATIAAGASCTVNVQYTPTAAAVVGTTYTANVSLALNTTLTPMTVALTGQLIPPPTVTFTSPINNATMAAPGNFTLTATATSTGSSVSKVEFFADNILINTDTTAPYSYQWNNVLPGTHSLIAIVTNALGKTAISTAVNVTVNAGVVQAFYIHTDHLDTPRLITNTAGQVVWRWDNSDPFGNNVPNENPTGQGTFTHNLGFAGQYRDRETNTFYNYFRDCYDPATGRYCQSDPIGLRGGINTYTYVLDNPLKWVDPKGLANGPFANPSMQPNPNGVKDSWDSAVQWWNQLPSEKQGEYVCSAMASNICKQGLTLPGYWKLVYPICDVAVEETCKAASEIPKAVEDSCSAK